MKIWVCSNCGTPIEPMFAQDYDDSNGFRCPGTAEGCSPHKSRELLSERQVEAVEVSLTAVLDAAFDFAGRRED